MKSLERRFKKFAEKHPDWGSCVIFAETIMGQNFNKQALHRWFYKLIEKDDYARNELKELMRWLEAITKSPEEDKKMGVVAH